MSREEGQDPRLTKRRKGSKQNLAPQCGSCCSGSLPSHCIALRVGPVTVTFHVTLSFLWPQMGSHPEALTMTADGESEGELDQFDASLLPPRPRD